jgi:hypothetical protein
VGDGGLVRPVRIGYDGTDPSETEGVRMAEEFEFRDLKDAVFWGVDLEGATFRDVNLSRVSVSHARIVDTTIDAFVDRLTINGVDVTDFVNEHDAWYPLRGLVHATEPAGMLRAWDALEDAWAETLAEASALTAEQRGRSVDGEWSFVETLRHLVFAMDKWCTVPLLGGSFHPIGIPNTGSKDFGWPGVDPDADPSYDDVLDVRADRAARFREHLGTLTPAELARTVEVLENGASSVEECVFVVLEEEFEHLRYARRDLAQL